MSLRPLTCDVLLRIGLAPVLAATRSGDAGDLDVPARPGAFGDVTRGGNNYLARRGRPANDTCRYRGRPGRPCYLATAGYDMATGLGSPRAVRLSAALTALASRPARRP
ncbi:MAG: hypothetical protein ACR2FU_22345 [Streptosporangiaceae bacterium]